MRGRGAAAQGRRRAAGYTQARETSKYSSCLFFNLAGIDELKGKIFTTCFLVRLERQLHGLENDRGISHVTCCHGCDK